jgi:hypothetical protein
MKILLILCCLIMFSFQNSLMAGNTSKHSEWRNGILILTFNGETRMFPSWTQEANDFYQNGPRKPVPPQYGYTSGQSSSNMQQQNSNKAAINSIERRLDAYGKTLSLQRDAIESLSFKNGVMRQEITRLRNLAFTRAWTDLDGNSFMGVFIEYNLGAVKVQKVLDNTSYTIPAGRLTPACKEMALALNKFK